MRDARAVRVAGAVWLCAGLAAAWGEQRPAGGLTLVVVPAIEGRLEPCGCAEGQQGGLPRMATLIQRLKTDAAHRGERAIVLCLGNWTSGLGPQSRFKARAVARSLAAMGCAGSALGELDWFLGADALAALREETGLPFLCANADTRGRARIGAANVRIAPGRGIAADVAAAASPAFNASLAALGRGTRFSEPLPALRAWVKAAASESVCRVLLLHGPASEAVRLARALPEADLVVASCAAGEGAPVTRRGRVVFVAPGDAYVAVIRLTGAPRPRVTSAEAAEVSHALPPHPAATSILEKYQQELKAADLLRTLRRKRWPGRRRFMGVENCRECHGIQYRKWSTTRHARAFDTLRKKGREWDPECVECHVVGLRFYSGFRSLKETPDLANVACECCHGPGDRHDRNVRAPYGRRDMRPCERCHNDEHSPGFDRRKALKKIRHWKRAKALGREAGIDVE